MPPPRCAVLICPMRPGWIQRAPELFDAPIATPTLIVRGATDDFAGAGPDELAEAFGAAERAEHPEGHRPMPAAKEAAQAHAGRIAEFVAKHCPP